MENSYGHMFIAGAILSLLEKECFTDDKSNLSVGLLFCSLLGCIGIQFYVQGITYGIYFAVFIAMTYIGVVLYRKKYIPSICLMLICRPVLFIATISYPLYLVHQNLGYIIIQNMERNGLTYEVLLIIPISIMVCLAYLLHRYIEKPCSKALNNICKQFQ